MGATASRCSHLLAGLAIQSTQPVLAISSAITALRERPAGGAMVSEMA